MSDRKGEEMTLPISTPIEVGMVTTRAQQLTLAQHEEEALTLESDGPEIHTLDPCYKGNQTEESEGKDEETAIPRIQPEPELEKRKSVQPLYDGAILALQLSKISLIDTLTRWGALSLYPMQQGVRCWAWHTTLAVAGHFGRERTLAMIQQRMDWPGLAKDVEELCRSCPICQRACPVVVAKASLHSLPICNQPF